MKICNICGIEKKLCDFHKSKYSKDGHLFQCKECRKRISSQFYEKNKIEISKRRSEKYYENHQENLEKDRKRISNEREKRNLNSKKYYVENGEKVRQYKKEHYNQNKKKYIEKAKKWEIDNKERKNKLVNERVKKRKKEDILFRLKIKLKTDIYISLKRKKRSKKIEEIIGLELNEYKNYIESKFESWMTWENWGKNTWHIDHITPLCSAKTEKEILDLWHYSNLRPISAKENLSKGGKIYD